MGYNTARLAIENVVKNSLANIEDNPERSLRNLVDMALQFAKDDSQRAFFRNIQKMLFDENSGYYILLKDVIQNVDKGRLQRFGINLGYNGCILGINKIKKYIRENKIKKPWIMNIDTDKNISNYDKFIEEGENNGIYIWSVITSRDKVADLKMAARHKESAFIIFVNGKDMTEEFIESALEVDNIMIVIPYDEVAEDISNILRKNKILYSVYYEYNKEDCKKIKDGEMIEKIQMLHPLFTFFIASENIEQNIKEDIYKYIFKARCEQIYNTILFDLYGDLNNINSRVYLG